MKMFKIVRIITAVGLFMVLVSAFEKGNDIVNAVKDGYCLETTLCDSTSFYTFE